jgi:hypothetical protein
MFLTCLIPGPNNPKSNIDVYLQPLVDDLQKLWSFGALTYDISTKKNFMLRAALMWTINDFSAYGMLSGWGTKGRLACPYYMNDIKEFPLPYGGKISWFDCHRRFLPLNHPFRRNRRRFTKNKVETDDPLEILSRSDVWQSVRGYPKVIDGPFSKLPGYGVEHNWSKRSIL